MRAMSRLFKMTLDLIVSKSDIDYIMCCALENGISGWSDDVKVCGEYLGEYIFEQISEGGCLLIHDKRGIRNHRKYCA